MSPSSNQLINVQFRKLEDIYISASQKNCTKCAHTVYNVTCLMKRKQLVAKSFTSLIYTNFNGRITGKVSDPESLSFYVGFDTPG